MSTDGDSIPPPAARRPALAVLLGAVAAVAGSAVAFGLLRGEPTPPPPEIAANPLLVEGREVYLARCVSCHGETGKGDGPIAKGLAGPPVRDLAGARWQHGDRPEDALKVVREGVANTAMPGWGKVLSDRDARAVTAYALHLGGREFAAALDGP